MSTLAPIWPHRRPTYTMKSQISVLICFACLHFEFKAQPLAPQTSKCKTALVYVISRRRLGVNPCPDMAPQAPHVHHEIMEFSADLLCMPPFRVQGATFHTTHIEMQNSTSICDSAASFGSPLLPRSSPTGAPCARIPSMFTVLRYQG